MTPSLITTYSFWQSFRNCRQACAYRYLEELAPLERATSLSFGTLIHTCLERWHAGTPLGDILPLIDRTCRGHEQEDGLHEAWHLARAMMTGYAERYPEEPFIVHALERTFLGRLRNPQTGRTIPSLRLAGKVDGIVEMDGQLYLLEHKTTASCDGAYLERLWLDTQITLYGYALQRFAGLPIAGAIYNVLVKARLQQGKGETEEAFAARRADLLAKSKTGKTSAQRKLPEADDEYQARLLTRYRDPGMFHREVILFAPEDFSAVEDDLWEWILQFRDARRRQVFSRNTSHCFTYGRPCAYLPLCRARGADHLKATLYERRPPHEELREAPVDTDPIF